MKKRNFAISIFIIAFLVFASTITSNAYASTAPAFSKNDPVVREVTNVTKGTTQLKVTNYGNTNAKTFYFYTSSSNPVKTYNGKTRNFKYNFELNGQYSGNGSRLLDASSCVGFDGKISDYNFKTVDDKRIAHDENGVFYLLNKVYEEQISSSMVAGSPSNIDTVFTNEYELIPIAKNVEIKIGDVKFSNLDEINQKGNFVLDSSNSYSAIYSDVRKTAENAVSIDGYHEGVIPFSAIEAQIHLFNINMTSSGEYIYNIKVGTPSTKVANGVTTYTLPATVKYDEYALEIYQDGDKNETQTYQLSLPSKSSGKLKVYYMAPEERNTSNATSKVVNVTNGNFSIDIPTGKKARFYVCAAESEIGSVSVKLPAVKNADTYWGYNKVVVGSQFVNDLYKQYVLDGKNNFHGLLLAHIEKNNLEKNKYEANLRNSEYGENACIFVYNKEVKPAVTPTTPTKPSQPQKPVVKPSKPTLNVSVKIKKPARSKKYIIVKWTKLSKKQQKQVQKIEVQYSTSKKFAKTTTYRVSKKTASKKITKLKRKTTYYVRVRAINGKKIGPWSTVKAVKTK